MAQRNPAFGELNAPGHTSWIALVALNRALQGLVFLRQLLESANSRHEPAIEFRQSHLHGQIQGAEANGTGLPALLATGTDQQLNHRHTELLPQGGSITGAIGLHRGKAGATDHRFNRGLLEVITNGLLQGGIPQPTHQQDSRAQPCGAQANGDLFQQRRVATAPQGPVGHHPHRWAWVGLPVKTERVGLGLRFGGGL